MEKGRKNELEEARIQLADELGKLIKASQNLFKPLKELNELQIAALVTLGYSMRIIMLAGRPATKISEGIFTSFKEVVDEVCPPLGKLVVAKDPCFEATVSYVSALAKCEADGKTEEECWESWGPGGQAVMCTMRELEDMKGIIEDIFMRLPPPPRPFPWPK